MRPFRRNEFSLNTRNNNDLTGVKELTLNAHNNIHINRQKKMILPWTSKKRTNVTGRENQLLLNVPRYNLAEIRKAERTNLLWKRKITTNVTAINAEFTLNATNHNEFDRPEKMNLHWKLPKTTDAIIQK